MPDSTRSDQPLAIDVRGIRRVYDVTAIGGPGSVWTQWTGEAAPGSVAILLVLLATGVVATLGAVAVFRASDRRAKDRGLLDQTTGS